MGTIKSRWVYSSVLSASANVLSSGCQPITSEIAHRRANCRDGDRLIIAFAAAVERKPLEHSAEDCRCTSWARKPTGVKESKQSDCKYFHVTQITDLRDTKVDTCRRKGDKNVSAPPPSVYAGRGLLRRRSGSRSPRFQAELPGLPASSFLPKPRRHASVRGGEVNLPGRMIALACRTGPQQFVSPRAHPIRVVACPSCPFPRESSIARN